MGSRDDKDSKAELIMNSVAIGVFAVDLDGVITYYNRAAEAITGLERKQALGRRCDQVFKSSLCQAVCPLRKAMETGSNQLDVEAVFIRHDGRSVLPVKVSAAPLHDQEGKLVGGVETFQSANLTKAFNRRNRGGYDWKDFIGDSPQIGQLFEVLKVVAPRDVTILIEGPTGTGKDLLAHIIHHNSPRQDQPLIKVNCAALPENLLESEMFGYVKGAFTGADKDKPGLFSLADGGTILLDEISEMPLALQAKLLRVLEDREFYPLGGRRTVKVDIRVLAACNKPLEGQVRAGLFREDLYYRLNVIRVHVPPLNQRRQDISTLINRILQKKNVQRGTFICRFDPEALKSLLDYDFPGNVRELENILEHACLLCQGDVIQTRHLPLYLRTGLQGSAEAVQAEPEPVTVPERPAGNEPEPRDDPDKLALTAALKAHNHNRTRTAQALGINRSTLWRRMKKHGLLD